MSSSNQISASQANSPATSSGPPTNSQVRALLTFSDAEQPDIVRSFQKAFLQISTL